MDDMRTKYDNVTFEIKTPDGTAYIIIVEDSPGKIEKIIYQIGKAGTSLNAWAFAVCELVTAMFKKGTEINEVLTLLSGITSARPVYDPGGVAVRSGPEALYLALLRYRTIYQSKSKVTFKEDFRSSKLGN